ncbi:hypothetical protein Dehly_1494 [Dehalogenimonas lykanthroporepellens BL-DC-9]|jgi:hypothetical protein|nr:hypothetical protein Dehly_1494 [Dehalogenimonas lykanthroporepellens BL-DC-9]
MGALIIISPFALYGVVLLVLSIRKPYYIHFGLGCFLFLVIAGVVGGLFDGFGVVILLIVGMGVAVSFYRFGGEIPD